MQSSTSQTPVSASPARESSGGPSTPNSSAPTPVAGTPTFKGPIGMVSESKQDSAKAIGVNGPGHLVSPPTFSYNLLPNSSAASGNSQQSSSSVVNPSVFTLQPPALSPSSSTSPLFSYISHGAGLPGGHQFQHSMNTSTAVAQDAGVASSVSQYAPLPVHASSSFTMSASSAFNMGPATSFVPSAPSFPMPPGMPATPGTPGPPGVGQSAQQSSNLTVSSGSLASSTAVLRPIVPAAPVPSNPVVQQQLYPYPSLPAIAASHPLWLQPPPLGNLARPPFLPYHVNIPGTFPLPARGMPLPSDSLPGSEPPGVTPVGNASEPPTTSAPSVHQLASSSEMQLEFPPPGIDSSKDVNGVGIKGRATIDERLEAWTVHKTDTGVAYYYNSFTGESTYEKPSCFQGESLVFVQPNKLTVQPAPVSWEKLDGTDWSLVSTNDGKRYYYNTKTKLSSWQIPTEVTELRKKQDGGVLKEHSVLVPNNTSPFEKVSAPVSLSAPAVNTGGRDATALRPSFVTGASSALDLIKKKLQDSGAPVTQLPVPALPISAGLEVNGSRAVDTTDKSLHSENSKDKLKDANGDGDMSDSSSDSEDVDSGPTKELCIIRFKEMLKERGVVPFSKWEKELPKLVFDPRFKAIPSHSARRSLFDHYVKTRAEEERKEKRAAQKAAIEGFKQLLEEASEDFDHNTDYHTFRKKWGNDPRFEVVDRKDRELLLNERVLPLKKAVEEKAQAKRAAAAFSFKSMLQEKGDITTNTRWSRVKDSLRNDRRYKSVKHEDRELVFNEYISELKAAEDEVGREAKAKRHEQEKLKERERELRKRKEREEEEMERVRIKVRRKEAISSYQALLVESIKDPQASWTESKPKLEKDPQERATNPELDSSDIEKLFREHVKMLRERCANEFRALLGEVITAEAAAQETEEGKTVLNSWSTAKRLLKSDPRYTKMPRKESESLWRRYSEETQRKQKLALDQKDDEKNTEGKGKNSFDSERLPLGSKRTHDRR